MLVRAEGIGSVYSVAMRASMSQTPATATKDMLGDIGVDQFGTLLGSPL